jgi:4-hydroxy-tetrahydrodipicolinate synthase
MFKGALVAIVTPFTNGTVDEESLRSLIEFQIENGTSGIVPCGTTGESPTLSHEEHKRVIEITVEQVKKRVPVVAGAGSNNTAEAIDLTKHAKAVGADAALHITPYYNKPTQEGLFRHYQAIAQEAKFPLVVYNIAGRTGVNIEPATMARMAQLPEIVAVKEASGNLGQMAEIVQLCGDKLTLMSGDDNLILPVMAIGGTGVISVISNIAPRQTADIIEAWEAGEVKKAQELYMKLLPLCKAMFLETNPIPVKTGAALMGLIKESTMRLPMCEMAEANLAKLKAVMTDFGLLK